MDETFSPKSARLAIEELFDAIPKSRKMEHLGALNEALVTLDYATKGLPGDKAVSRG